MITCHLSMFGLDIVLVNLDVGLVKVQDFDGTPSTGWCWEYTCLVHHVCGLYSSHTSCDCVGSADGCVTSWVWCYLCEQWGRDR
jgi:hypothetical protein